MPKISLNKFYTGTHWTKRKKIKDDMYWAVISQIGKEKLNQPCTARYDFHFKTKPLDCSNAVGMVKLIEDVIFEDDNTEIVKGIEITSNENKVVITIKTED